MMSMIRMNMMMMASMRMTSSAKTNGPALYKHEKRALEIFRDL